MMFVVALVFWLAAQSGADRFTQTFDLARSSDVVATVRARCANCSWGEAGREAAAIRVTVDGAYSQHILLARGDVIADYPVTLGSLAAGRHTIAIERDQALSAAQAGPATIDRIDVRILAADGSDEA